MVFRRREIIDEVFPFIAVAEGIGDDLGCRIVFRHMAPGTVNDGSAEHDAERLRRQLAVLVTAHFGLLLF